jgi:hypothetical protein
LIKEASASFEADKQMQLLARATEIAVADNSIIPIAAVNVFAATKNTLNYTLRVDRHMYAMGVRPK